MPHKQSRPPATVATQLHTAEALCSERGKRLTPIRRKVLEILLAQRRSVKAYELLDMIRAVQPGAAPPTVYRALDFLVEEGLVHRLDAITPGRLPRCAGTALSALSVRAAGAAGRADESIAQRQLAERVSAAVLPFRATNRAARAVRQCHREAPKHGIANISPASETGTNP